MNTHLPPWLALLRPVQWSKNLLIGTALLTSHRLSEMALWWPLLQLFAAFCAVASAIYVLNDWLDRDADRAHPDKCRRPIASGAVGAIAVWTLLPVLALLALLAAWTLAPAAQLALLLYALLALAYCLGLKRLLWLDVVVLAGLYALRVIAGAWAIAVPPSAWLIAFALFVFLSLAILKRYAELIRLGSGRMPGRAYAAADLPVVLAFGSGVGLLAVLVLALYVNSEQVRSLYRQPEWIWLLCPLLLYWLARQWTLAARGELRSDPLLAALTDPSSYAVAGAGAVLVWMAM